MGKQPRKASWLVSLLTALVVWPSAALLASPICRSGDHPVTTAGYVGSDGKQHVPVSIGGAIAGDLFDAIVQAMYEWNAHSSRTNIIFEFETSEHSGALFIDFGDTDTDPCAFAWFASAEINLTTDMNVAAANDLDNTAHLIAHEIGHFLMLDDGASSGIMVNYSSSVSDCTEAVQTAGYPSIGVTEDDAETARDCVDNAGTTFLGGGGEEEYTDWGECERWLVVVHYECYGVDCEPTWYDFVDYLGECEPVPPAPAPTPSAHSVTIDERRMG